MRVEEQLGTALACTLLVELFAPTARHARSTRQLCALRPVNVAQGSTRTTTRRQSCCKRGNNSSKLRTKWENGDDKIVEIRDALCQMRSCL